MAKRTNRRDGFCKACRWKERMLVNLALAIDRLSHELGTASKSHRDSDSQVKQLMKGRFVQQAAILMAFDEALDEDFDVPDRGSLN